jgi:3-phenylpropionate/trans-cinnamate dioxygenase ferredoxin reductase subunit
LDVAGGIVVDDHCRTSDPAVYAVGDCSLHPCSEHGGMRRLESVPNASEQARVVAAAIVGTPKAYLSVPWFWSDQYDLKFQSVGLSTGYDTAVVRGTTSVGRSFSVFYLKDGQVRAADVVSNVRDLGVAKKLVAARMVVGADRLADTSRPLKELLTDHAVAT